MPRSTWDATPATRPTKSAKRESRIRLSPDQGRSGALHRLPRRQGRSLHKAHHDQPFGTANCTQCHDPHQSAQPKLMRQFTHPPFADKSCDTCHAPAKDGKVVLTKRTRKRYASPATAIRPSTSIRPKFRIRELQGDCTDCHNPHAGRRRASYRPIRSMLSGMPQRSGRPVQEAHLHQPAFRQGCATCHEPHGGDNEHLLRAKKLDALCLECHGPDRSTEETGSRAPAHDF